MSELTIDQMRSFDDAMSDVLCRSDICVLYNRVAEILLMPVDWAPEEQGCVVYSGNNPIPMYNGDLIHGTIGESWQDYLEELREKYNAENMEVPDWF